MGSRVFGYFLNFVNYELKHSVFKMSMNVRTIVSARMAVRTHQAATDVCAPRDTRRVTMENVKVRDLHLVNISHLNKQ